MLQSLAIESFVVLTRFSDVLAILFQRLSHAAEAATFASRHALKLTVAGLSGLDRSRDIVLKLSALFALDSFGGGFVIQSFAAYWFHLRFNVDPGALGVIFFWANFSQACRRWRHPGGISNRAGQDDGRHALAVQHPADSRSAHAHALVGCWVLLVRFSISQMDVPTRQSFVMAVVPPEERSAAAGVTGVARTVGAAISPLFAGMLFAHPALISVPFFVAGVLKSACTT